MKLNTIITIGKELRSTYDCQDPELLCAGAGVISLLFPMGTARKSIKGFILSHSGNVAITVNSDLSPDMIRVIRYHEFAHYILHVRTGLAEAVHDSDIYDASSQAEYEANLLAAELQLEDAEVLRVLKETGDFYAAAGSLHVPPELLDFKFRLMREKGYKLPEVPVTATGSYLLRFNEGA